VSEQERIGLVGVGAMGGPIAAALLDAGHALAIFDRRREAMRPLVERGALECTSASDVGDMAATVFASLPGPEIVRSVVLGEGGLVDGSTIKTFVELSTIGATVAAEVATGLGRAGIAYLDAPVSGGVAGAAARTLAVMASGEPALFDRMRPLLETFGRNVFWIGPEPGQGQTAKLLNNLLSATSFAITSEAVTFGVRAGLDPATLLEIFNAGSGRNTATSDKFPQHVLTRGFGAGFRLDLMAKDVELCLSEARSKHVPMILGGIVQQLWTLASALADEGADHTEFVRLYEDWNGISVTES
jgi:3-hydroxyisobutyrate dehydrogenase-like beta-hydroxyacid dehydrogenase